MARRTVKSVLKNVDSNTLWDIYCSYITRTSAEEYLSSCLFDKKRPSARGFIIKALSENITLSELKEDGWIK